MTDHLPADFHNRLVAECPDAVIYADAGGCIRFWNAAATRIFRFAENEALGMRLDLIIPERLRARHWEGFDKVMAGEPSRYGEGELLAVPALHKDGRQISVEFTILPLHDELARLIGIAAFLRDATARFEEVRGLRREIAALKGART
ncbi:MAG TPA: PAS domain-containing protein [Stellaceae bacterium]|nr:PAS domain-containing protein [Stellaceae bacterium]